MYIDIAKESLNHHQVTSENTIYSDGTSQKPPTNMPMKRKHKIDQCQYDRYSFRDNCYQKTEC